MTRPGVDIALAFAMLAFALDAGARSFPEAVVAQGRALAIAGDCAGCHSPKGGPAFSGGYPVPTPLGPIYATNITPSASSGIGRYSQAQFEAALRKGIRADGAHLYPAMPYTAYAGLTNEDVQSLYAYFMEGVAAADVVPPRTQLPFPFNVRSSLAVWNALYLKNDRFKADPAHDAQWNRGAYLTNTLEHCSTCHTPRGLLMQERPDQPLSGGVVGAWYAPNITSDSVDGIGGWDIDEVVAYLKTGRAIGKAGAAGPMAEAITHSLALLPESDIRAIAAYLTKVPPASTGGFGRPSFGWGKPASVEAVLRGAATKPSGASLYSGLCASCHGADGQGTADHAIPALFNNTTVGATRADNLVAVILEGVDRDAAGTRASMPGFGDDSHVQALTNAEVAAVANYTRNVFGPASLVTEDDVAMSRRAGTSKVLRQLERWIAACIVLVILIALIWAKDARAKRRKPHEMQRQNCF